MSAAMVQAVLRSEIEPAGVRLVALVLAWHTNEGTGLAWPSLGTMARETCLSRDRIKQCVKTLRDAAVIEVATAGAGGAGLAATTRYRFCESWVGKQAHPVSPLPGERKTRYPVSPLPPPGEPTHPNKDERQAKPALSSKSRRTAAGPAASGAGSSRAAAGFPARYTSPSFEGADS